MNNIKTIKGRILGDVYPLYEPAIDGQKEIRIKVETDSEIITLYHFMDDSIDFEDTTYSSLTHYTPISISYHSEIRDILTPHAYDFKTGETVYKYEEFRYNQVDSFEIIGNAKEDLIRDRKISNNLITDLKNIINPINGILVKEKDKLLIQLPENDKTFNIELYEPDSNGYRVMLVGYDYLEPWGCTEDNTDKIVKYEIQKFVNYALEER